MSARSALAILTTAAAFSGVSHAALTISVDAAPGSPQPVATRVRWSAQAHGESGAGVSYRFRAREAGSGAFELIRDFGPVPFLDWTAAMHEGAYEVEVTAVDQRTRERATVTRTFQMTARARSGSDRGVVSATDHPLVFLYSVPPCPAGRAVHIEFQTEGTAAQATPERLCDGARSVNFYLAGLYPETQYRARHIIDGGATAAVTEEAFTTPPGPIPVPAATTLVGGGAGGGSGSGFLLHAAIFPNKQIATDLAGRLVWYYPGDISFITRLSGDGRFLGVTVSPDGREYQTFREFDIAGYTTKETNAARVNEQLRAMGRRLISGFHHEALRLEDGRILALAGVEQMISRDGIEAPVNVLGDMIIVFDQDLQVVWTWDTFDHPELARPPVLGETCALGGCPTLFDAPDAEDWVHGNSVQPAAHGAALIYSSRHLDWIVKIDFANGRGSGRIEWIFGKDGEFQLTDDAGEAMPWFSHQHDARLLDDGRLLVYDNGNTRVVQQGMPDSTSRGQVYQLDEGARTATLALNAELGGFAFALGSAQPLDNGNYHFNSGWMPDGSSRAIEVSPAGDVVRVLSISIPAYRSFRIANLYTGR